MADNNITEAVQGKSENDQTGERKHLAVKRVIGIVSVLIFCGLMVWVAFFVGRPLIDELFSDKNGIGAFNSAVLGLRPVGCTIPLNDGSGMFTRLVAENPVSGRLIYVGIQILQVFIALIPGEVVEIAGGVAFGALEGMALSLFGVAIGSSIIFLLTKTLGMRFVTLFVDKNKINELKFIRTDKRLDFLVFIVYFIPGTPKDLMTYVVALTRMRLPAFLLISLVARIPSVLSSTWGGDAIISGQYLKAGIIFGAALLLSVVGILVYSRVKKSKKGDEAQGHAD